TSNILWAADFGRPRVRAFDMTTRSVIVDTQVPELGWDIKFISATDEVYVSSLNSSNVFVLDGTSGELVEVLELGIAPGAMVPSADGRQLYVALSGQDEIAVVDTARRSVISQFHGAPEPKDSEGVPLANINLSALALNPMGTRLYAARGTDNAVSVFDTTSLDFLGAFPTAEYPTALAFVAGQNQLLVAEGRGGGSTPSMGRRAKSVIAGSTTLVDLDTIDFDQSSAQVLANYAYPQTAFPFQCEGRFPIPSRPNQRSPIKHVILLVKENKTFDCVFGDLEGVDADVDPSLVRYGRAITPNLHALAQRYALSDNFYTEVEDSDVGHIMLTATHVTEFVHRIWVEKDRSAQIPDGYQFSDNAHPAAGNFFTHLLDNGIDIRIFGEVVGILNRSPKTGRQAVDFSDENFPGGGFVNYGVTDEEKARYIADQIERGDLAQFTYVLLPNDHTVGTRPGFPTPESMVADNDLAVGILAGALSRSPLWEKSAMIIVQDDPQGCRDHVDAHRSFVMVVSPWAKRGHISHVLGSFVSIFATIERILNVPAMGRGDGLAAPLWDMFTATPDLTPYEPRPREVPVTMNTAQFPGAAMSQRMSFRGPDRNPGLAVVLDAYRLWRMGRISREEAQRRIDEPVMGLGRWTALLEESFEETFAFDAAFAKYAQWLRARGKAVPILTD
ncbi:MAG: alkaline phosphatase family protein, partial [Myxococcota bacterium]|nr:alkaline phosphatase family protein [Myxococcota bacterium]